jgi:hypothetical protein
VSLIAPQQRTALRGRSGRTRKSTRDDPTHPKRWRVGSRRAHVEFVPSTQFMSIDSSWSCDVRRRRSSVSPCAAATQSSSKRGIASTAFAMRA